MYIDDGSDDQEYTNDDTFSDAVADIYLCCQDVLEVFLMCQSEEAEKVQEADTDDDDC